nr:hypothetical protein [Tanacetum cinerariifolium]
MRHNLRQLTRWWFSVVECRFHNNLNVFEEALRLFEALVLFMVVIYIQIVKANPFPNHVVNLPDDEQVQPEPAPALLGFASAVLDIY